MGIFSLLGDVAKRSLERTYVIFQSSNIWMSRKFISHYYLGREFPFNLKIFLEICLKGMIKSGGSVLSDDNFIS